MKQREENNPGKSRELEMKQENDRCRELVEMSLEGYFKGNIAQKTLTDAMRYSLLAGGKRIRPIMVLQFCKAVGGDIGTALPCACAVEMLHTYSLIHDDLPCMDDDALRRGKPTNHVVFGECTATLAGDALQAEAFRTLLSAELPSAAVVRMGRTLAGAAGIFGICGGQILDMEGEKKVLSEEELTRVHEMKTASMLVASARIGVMAGMGSERQLDSAERYARALGLAFQIRDDVLDFTSTTEELGKPVGSDAENGKSTFVTVMGIGECTRRIKVETKKAITAVKGEFKDTEFLCWLASELAERKY